MKERKQKQLKKTNTISEKNTLDRICTSLQFGKNQSIQTELVGTCKSCEGYKLLKVIVIYGLKEQLKLDFQMGLELLRYDDNDAEQTG